MKAVMISIKPQWVEKIASGKKTIEVRKSAPKEVPFKAYIYCTNGEYSPTNCGKKSISDCLILNRNVVNGKVIGEFVCDRIICSQAYFDSQETHNHPDNYRHKYSTISACVFPEDIKKTCLDEYDLWDYIAGKAVKANQMYDGYLWHISELKIYDKPKELSEFVKAYPIKCGKGYESIDCTGCGSEFTCAKRFITRPPQSWQYVEELEKEE